MKHLVLVDASGFAHRAFHALPATYRAKDGFPTWAILGFMDMVWKMLGRLQADPADYGAAVFDFPGKNFRHKLFPEYKANRAAGRSEELNVQLPVMRHAAEALGLCPIEAEGYEADDLIASLCAWARAQNIRTTIVSSDKDFGQLVEDGWVEIADPMSRKRVGEAEIKERWGVKPKFVPEVQAFMGDSVDNIPGIPGCGDKKASLLIRRFNSIEGVLENLNLIRWPAIERELRKKGARKRLELYRDLATLRSDVEIPVTLEELTLSPTQPSHVKEILRFLDAAHKYEAMFGQSTDYDLVADKVPNPKQWWRDAVAGKIAHLNDTPLVPQVGFYQRRLVRGGPWVPCRIWRDPQMDFETERPTGRDIIRCEVNGKIASPVREWDILSRYPIKEELYDYMVANAAWAKQHSPNEAIARPTEPINWLTEPV